MAATPVCASSLPGGAQVTVTSAGGGIAITGTSGAGAGTFFNVGVNVSTALIQDTGDGAVNVTGFGGAGQADNSGVAIEGATTKIEAGNGGGSSGVLTIIGHGATGVSGFAKRWHFDLQRPAARFRRGGDCHHRRHGGRQVPAAAAS